MECPRCHSKVETRSTGGVEIDECSSCQGIWLTADELRDFFRDSARRRTGAAAGPPDAGPQRLLHEPVVGCRITQ